MHGSSGVNRPDFHGGGLVKVKLGFWSSRRVAHSRLPQPQPQPQPVVVEPEGTEMKPLLGLFSFDLDGEAVYICCAVVLFLMFCIARRTVQSPFCLTLRGVRQNAFRMSALGTPVNWRLVGVYTLGAPYAGIARGCLARSHS